MNDHSETQFAGLLSAGRSASLFGLGRVSASWRTTYDGMAGAGLIWLGLLLLTTAAAVRATPVLVANPSFETPGPGATAPLGWILEGGRGAWETTGASGTRSISVSGTGDDTNAWFAQDVHLLPAHRYRLRFMSRREGGSGTTISGLTTNNRDYQVGTSWGPFSFIFRTPDSGAGPLRFGQWHAPGKIFFDSVSLSEVIPYYVRRGALELGSGERVDGNHYDALTRLNGDASNDARFLESHTAGFNSDRWTFGEGATVVYRHMLTSVENPAKEPAAANRPASADPLTPAEQALPQQVGAEVTVGMNYHVAGRCVVEARTGHDWMPVGEISAVGGKTFTLPAALFPARSVEVRLSSAVSPGESGAPEFQVDSYHYSASLDRSLPALAGATNYADIMTDLAPDISVVSWGSLRPGAGAAVVLRVGPASCILHGELQATDGMPAAAEVKVIPRAGASRLVTLPYVVTHPGPHTLRVRVERKPGTPAGQGSAGNNATVFDISTAFRVSALDAADFGSLAQLAPEPASRNGTQMANTAIWWATDTHKIGQTRPAPGGKRTELTVEAARGEERPVQLVLRPGADLDGVTATLSPFRGPRGAQISVGDWTIRHTAYVPVTQPTDSAGAVGNWPDPLPPYDGPFKARANENSVLWLSVRVPRTAAAGDYQGLVTLKAGPGMWRVPINLHVWNFTIPATPHVRSCMGISPGAIKQYHNLKTDAQLRQVWELYMQDFAAHRMSPSNAMALDPIRVQISGAGDDAKVTLDTTNFDRAAHHYLDEMGFTAFTLPIEGMGGGTFYSRAAGTFGGFKAGTPGYDRLWGAYIHQLAAHLQEKGWLKKAYAYWFDEPSEQDFPFVREGMERLKKYAPGLTRLLTKEPEPGLIGAVDLWCPILNAYQPASLAARQAKGEQVWWYICTGPKTPFPGEFIDRPGTDLPVWVWDTWRYGVQGLLIWETTYWNSPEAYPGGQQDPWTDPMSWTTSYGTPSGARQPWGNGDGRFLYPPTSAARAAGDPILTGPVDSQRWELLRDGLEDYEYFWLLRDAIGRARQQNVSQGILSRCTALLSVPANVAASLTQYSADPRPLEERRAQLARAIEELDREIARRPTEPSNRK